MRTDFVENNVLQAHAILYFIQNCLARKSGCIVESLIGISPNLISCCSDKPKLKPLSRVEQTKVGQNNSPARYPSCRPDLHHPVRQIRRRRVPILRQNTNYAAISWEIRVWQQFFYVFSSRFFIIKLQEQINLFFDVIQRQFHVIPLLSIIWWMRSRLNTRISHIRDASRSMM